MKSLTQNNVYELDISKPIWDHFFTVAPLVVIGTKEGDYYDLAPKHMATPIGFNNYFGFVCTPNHATYGNIKQTGEFSVSFPIPNQITLTSLSASPRCDDNINSKPMVDALPTIKASNIDALFMADSYLYLECKRFKIIDGFHENSIITGKIVSAFVHKDYKIYLDNDEQQQIKNNPLLAYIANGRFAKITETFNFPYPKNFKR